MSYQYYKVWMSYFRVNDEGSDYYNEVSGSWVKNPYPLFRYTTLAEERVTEKEVNSYIMLKELHK